MSADEEVDPGVKALYFAYGSCMSPHELERDVQDYTIVGRAVVRGFRLGFTRFSRNWGGGVADLVPDIHAEVEGVLYRLPFHALTALDEREGAPDHYRRDFIGVRTVDGKIHDRVLTYVVNRKLAGNIAPHADYASALLSGAIQHLSNGYVNEVRLLIERLTEEQRHVSEARAARLSREQRRSPRERSIVRSRRSLPKGRDAR